MNNCLLQLACFLDLKVLLVYIPINLQILEAQSKKVERLAVEHFAKIIMSDFLESEAEESGEELGPTSGAEDEDSGHSEKRKNRRKINGDDDHDEDDDEDEEDVDADEINDIINDEEEEEVQESDHEPRRKKRPRRGDCFAYLLLNFCCHFEFDRIFPHTITCCESK